MPKNLRSKILLYADDSKLISAIDGSDCNINILTQYELQTLVDWSNEWLMKFKLDKSKEMHYRKSNNKFPYVFSDKK